MKHTKQQPIIFLRSPPLTFYHIVAEKLYDKSGTKFSTVLRIDDQNLYGYSHAKTNCLKMLGRAVCMTLYLSHFLPLFFHEKWEYILYSYI